jgi:ParB family chromosome partitioning protein
MARKNVFGASDENEAAVIPEAPPPLSHNRPLLGMERPLRHAAPVGAVSHSLSGITERAKRAEEIERKLAEGQAVVELDPVAIDGSFVVDRMDATEQQRAAFMETIREQGQQVPILVRPKPGASGRYEVAYGHRRLRAAMDLGRPVKAVVRNLSDEELVVAQGQENSARTDLTFIERARFAARLEDRRFSRDTIMAALNVDKAALSRLIAVASRIPPDVIEAIGPAPNCGRVRWQELTDLLSEEEGRQKARTVIANAAFGELESDKRFERLYATVREPAARPSAEPWSATDGTRLVRIQRADKKLTLAFDQRVAPAFGEFVTSKLQQLYDEFLSRTGDED